MNNYLNTIKKYLVILSLTFFLLGFTFSNSLPAEKEVIFAYNMYNLGRIISSEQIAQNTKNETSFTGVVKAPDLPGTI